MDRNYLIIISGLPRSGTSLLMQMLQAGGIPLLYDMERLPDEANPNGYFEYSKIKTLTNDADLSWLYSYKGYAVKIVSPILSKLKIEFPTRVIFMNRSIDEIIQSQQKMLTAGKKPSLKQSNTDKLHKIYTKHIKYALKQLQINPYIKILEVSFQKLFIDTDNTIREIADFLDNNLDLEKIKSAIKPELYRCK